MNASRRDILKYSLGAGAGAAALALMPGCETVDGQAVTRRPDGLLKPDFGKNYAQNSRPPFVSPPSRGPLVDTTPLPPGPVPPVPPAPSDPGPVLIAGLDIQPRKAWTTHVTPANMGNINPLGEVKHITVHHEGWTAVDFIDRAETIDRLEKIRGAHTRSKRDGGRGWADIGYHFVVDRAGRIWEARNLKYQGAHVESCNENNLGIMCLGNFENQMPSQAQLDSLVRALKAFKAHYKVPMGEIFTHQEWKRRCPTTSTECPGRNLQARMAGIRKASVIG